MSLDHHKKQQTLLSAISAIPLLLPLLILLLATTNSRATEGGSNNQQHGSYSQRPDTNGRPQLMVATHCTTSNSAKTPNAHYHNQYLEIESRKWRSDRDSSPICDQDKQELLNYCRKVYPNHDIRNIVESSRLYKIDNWCKMGTSKRRCRTRLTVKPYRCLEGTFQSDALLVPEHCLFDHVHNKSICESSEHWNKTASDNCQAKNMALKSFGMLQPCGLSVFSGVEFVCCPQQASDVSRNKEASAGKAASRDETPFQAHEINTKVSSDADEKFNNIKTDDEIKKHHDQSDSDDQEDSDVEDEEEDEYEDDEDEYDDDSSTWNSDRASSTTSTTTTTTTTTQRPIDHYLSHFDLAHEHDEFRRAELAVESNYRDKITHVMREWSQLDGHYEEMKKKDPQGAEDFKKKMTHQFQKTIEALEEEGAAQRHQLASMHAERAMAIINRRKKAAMDCLTKALDKMPIRTHQVEKCIVKLLRALEKDRSHTLRQYKNLLNLNTREALREKKIILDHLVTLNRAANQSIAMLDRSPVLVEKLKNKIVALWHKLRNVPLDEPIVRMSELKIMEKYEEEVAQAKIERERQRLMEQEAQQETQKQASDESKTDAAKQPASSNPIAKEIAPQTTSTGKPEAVDPPTSAAPQHPSAPVTDDRPVARSSPHTRGQSDEIDNEIPYQLDPKFAHLKAEPASYHELSYSVKHEPIQGQMRFGYSTLLVSACTLVIVLALFGLRYYSKHSRRAYRRQGFAEVGRSCPEEKSVTNMQFNGYENPAYKFFEAEA